MFGSDLLESSTFELEVDGSPHDWQLHEFALTEGISTVYQAGLSVRIPSFGADVNELLGKTAKLSILRGGERRRFWGIISEVKELGSDESFVYASLSFVPALWLLGLGEDCRIFQNMTVQEIVSKVLDESFPGLNREYEFKLWADYLPREYCTQYRESRLNFILRILAEEGIVFFFEHGGDEAEKLIFIDDPGAVEELDPATIEAGSARLQGAREIVMSVAQNSLIRPKKVSLGAYDFTLTDLERTGEAEHEDSASNAEDRRFPAWANLANYSSQSYQKDDLETLAKAQVDRYTAEASGFILTSNVASVQPGRWFSLVESASFVAIQDYMIISCEHRGRVAEQGNLSAEAGAASEYSNRMHCLKKDQRYRAPLRKRPRTQGPETAKVVGPKNEEIYVDEHGRVKLQFHWDREGKSDENSSCWVRVVQGWGGLGFGSVFHPRIGSEVLVNFLHGDPDQPIVVGSIYNGTNTAPYPLPDDKSKSSIKTQTYPGGDGFNELRFEDAAGKEEVFIHAQKDMNEVVKNDHTVKVGHDETITIDGQQTIILRGNQNFVILGEGEPPTPPKEGEAKEKTRGGAFGVTGDWKVDASKTIKIQAPDSITLTCGGSVIHMTPGAISLTAGDGSKIVLDRNVLIESSQHSTALFDANICHTSSGGSKTLLDANALIQASGGGNMLCDANVKIASAGGSSVVLDPNIALNASGGASVVMDTNAAISAASVAIAGKTEATMSCSGSKVTVNPAMGELNAPMANVTASAVATISGSLVKLN